MSYLPTDNHIRKPETGRYQYFRETRLWPLADNLNYEQWLANFSDGIEKEIALHILDFFTYIPDCMVNQMLATVIGKCGYYFKHHRRTWDDNSFKNDCWYSFIPGEDLKPTDSGYLFNRKLRDIIHIPEQQIIAYPILLDRLAESKNQNVILVDDFVGSGQQACIAWNMQEETTQKTLQELANKNNHKIIYAPLIVNYIGEREIQKHCQGLALTFIHLLTSSDSLSAPDCPCWKGDKSLYNQAMDLIVKKSACLGIPTSPNGHYTTIDTMGFHKQGLALAFEHGMPDACPPIFYWETANWKPLIKKVYQRP